MAAAETPLPAPGIPTGPLADELLNDPAINRVLDAVRGHLGVEIAFVSRYINNGMRELTHVSTDLDVPMGPGFREPIEESYCWHILEGRLPELIKDPADHPFTQDFAITKFLPVGTHLNVPLRLSDGRVWGSFCALGCVPDQSMTERDLNTVRAFAGLAAERIESAMNSDIELAEARERVADMLDGHAITIFQQPIHRLDDNQPVGVECLARFPNNNKRGPEAWFDDAEKVGLGVQLEMAAIRCALETLGHVPDGKYASVNASPATILSGLLDRELAGCDSAKLVIEVTEHQQVEDFSMLARQLTLLRKHARIAIDDVGTGYSGLRHIVDFKPDILKMDMALTRDIHRDPARRALTGALVQLSREIDCVLIAEGIETVEERDAMAALGVTAGQGYYYARPLPVVAAQQHLLGTAVAVEDVDREERPAEDPAPIAPLKEVPDKALRNMRRAARG